jgi:hypothetical protein
MVRTLTRRVRARADRVADRSRTAPVPAVRAARDAAESWEGGAITADAVGPRARAAREGAHHQSRSASSAKRRPRAS